MDRGGSLSRACQKAVTGIRQALPGLASLRGTPAYSADGKVQAVRIEVGRFLGIGDRIVMIDRSRFEELADRIRLRINSDAVRSLPDAQRQ